MVMGVVSSTGEVCPPIFVERKERLNADAYIELLDKKILPWSKKSSGTTLFSLKAELRVITPLTLMPS
uniref:Uncharacterized protein n=1 Tax=Lepeophtheirus salmonis TaxID=72036 RepID=A0A0K2V1P5_LEPSM